MTDLTQMPSSVHEAMWQMFKDGPIWDGDLVSKEARNWLVLNDMADRAAGFNFLTVDGVEMAVSLEMHRRKEKERHK